MFVASPAIDKERLVRQIIHGALSEILCQRGGSDNTQPFQTPEIHAWKRN
jgi:hypothetical protein